MQGVPFSDKDRAEFIVGRKLAKIFRNKEVFIDYITRGDVVCAAGVSRTLMEKLFFASCPTIQGVSPSFDRLMHLIFRLQHQGPSTTHK